MRKRTSYPKPVKAQIVQECLQPGVSIASVALRHGVNANLVRKWIIAISCRDESPQACAEVFKSLRGSIGYLLPLGVHPPWNKWRITPRSFA
ncbi:hypothetical protein CXB38_16385 [Pseudomonas syringae]|uniref:transposase n=1 Tax=Pseudomonas syringae TaxID=317 RepID=UPI000CDB4004|nr:transposase [Pseudomonas syringae]POP80509.1 hypothetical protein CXB38_16385 [Pseudomonas syringae]